MVLLLVVHWRKSAAQRVTNIDRVYCNADNDECHSGDGERRLGAHHGIAQQNHQHHHLSLKEAEEEEGQAFIRGTGEYKQTDVQHNKTKCNVERLILLNE